MTERVVVSNDVGTGQVGTYNGPWGTYLVGVNPQTTFFWCSRGAFGLNRTWDDNYPLADVPVGSKTSGPMNTVATLAVGDTFAIEYDVSNTIHTIKTIDPVAPSITFEPGLAAEWTRTLSLSRGGNWFDRDGVFRGTNHFVSKAISTSDESFDISAIDGDLFMPNNLRLTAATIDGQPVPVFLLWNPNGGTAPFKITDTDSQVGVRTIVKNPARGTTLRIVRDAGAAPITVIIDKVAGSTIPDYPMVVTEPRTEPTIWRHSFIGGVKELKAAFVSTPGSGIGAETGDSYVYAYSPEYRICPVTKMPFFRFRIPGYDATGKFINNRGLSWVKVLPQPLDEVFMAWAFRVRGYTAHVNDAGVKWPGMKLNITVGHRYELMGFAAENPGLIAMGDYVYGAPEFQGTFPYANAPYAGPGAKRRKTPRNAMIREGLGRDDDPWYWQCIQTKVNTPGLSDGIRRSWLNGNPPFIDVTDFNWRGADPTAKIVQIQWQVYHGGKAAPSSDRPDHTHTNPGPIEFDFAELEVSDKYIGPPPKYFLPAVQPPGDDMTIIEELRAQLATAVALTAAKDQEIVALTTAKTQAESERDAKQAKIVAMVGGVQAILNTASSA